MKSLSNRPMRRRLGAGLVAGVSVLALAACTSNTPEESGDDSGGGTSEAESGSNDEAGDTVTIGFSAPAADHGWMAAITNAAKDEAEKYDDIDLQVAEGTNDVNLQISQVETFINDEVDAIVLLPFDGAAMTPVALQAMEAGIPVCQEAGEDSDAVVAEIAGIDSLPLTQDRSQGFEDALSECGLDVDNRVAADFTVEGGERAAANLLQAAPQIDYLWNHDDDQGVGVLAAIENAGRDEFTMIGGAGSANAMREIESGESVLKATVIYPSTQGADGIKLARLLVQQKTMSDLVENAVPRTVQLYAPVVTQENVEEFMPSAFES
jgi:ribose transport system substrate-binding protein